MWRPAFLVAAFCLLGVAIEANPICVNKAADVMFVLDSSSSIWIVDYQEKLKFVADLVKSFGAGRGDSQIRIGAIIFSDQSHLEFSFDTYNKPSQLKRAILDIPHIGGGTNTADALRLLEEEVEPYLRYSKGPTIAVVITDGQSQDHAATKEEARKLHKLGVIVYAIGVGEQFDINELEAIASNPHYVFTVSSYSALKEIKDAIYVRVCEETVRSKLTTSPRTTTTAYEGSRLEITVAPNDRQPAAGLPETVKHECINKAADVMFVLDSSTSIWIEDYKQKLKFVADLVKSFGVGGANSQIRIGAITFSDKSQLEFSFDTYTNPSQLKRAILDIPHIGGGTNTADALRLLEEQVEPYLRYSKGPTIAVVITDGQSQDHAATKEEARKLHELGVIVYAIGVGDKYDINELKAIASNQHYVFTVSSYSALKEIKDAIYVRVCEEESGTSNHRPTVVPTTTTQAPTEIVTAGSITPDSSKCINKAADVMFVLDSSTSIWIVDYKQKLKFVADLVKSFGVGGANSQIRIGAITFSDQSHLEFSFDTYNKPFQLKRAILNIPHIGGGTNTADALRLLEEEVEPYLRYSKGPTIAVVITDGQSQDHAATKEEARKLHELGVIVYAIGVGDKYDINELKAIASNPHYVFTVSSYSALKEIKDAIYVRVCEEESGTSNHRPTAVPTITTPAPTEIVTAGSITPDSTKCINKAADVMFVLDSSTSIWIEDYKQKLKFVADLVKNFGVGGANSQIRIGAITFSDQSHLEFSFDTYNKPFQLKRAILNIPHIGGGTNTADALRLLEEKVEPYLRYSKGPTIAVVITDGQSQDHAATKEEARKLHELGVIVYAIGVGDKYDINELKAIASNPRYVFTVSSYSALKEIKDAIYVRVCEEESGTSNHRETVVPTTTTQAPTEIVTPGSITPDSKKCINKAADVMFVLDSSTSIWIEDYKQKLKFVADLVKSFGVGRGDSQIRIGAITFSDQSHLEFSFDTYTKPFQLKRAILNIPHIGGGTNTADALRLLEEQVEPYLRYSKGPTIAVVITDGQSQDHGATKEEARKLHKLGVIVYAIGVGEQFDINELEAIASNPHYVFTVSSYSALKEIKNAIYVRVCEEESGPSNPRSTAVPTITAQAPTGIVIAGSITPDPSSIILFGYDLVAMGAYRSGMIHQFINTLLPYTGYGHFGVVTYGYCPSRFNVPITPLKDNDASTIINSILVDIALPNLVDVVREMRKMFHSHSMQNDQSGHFENQVAVLFIDPSITTITSELTKVIEMLKRRGVKLYLVNVGTCPSSQLDQLYSLSSQPYRKYMFNAPSYHQLLLKAQYDPLHFKSIYNEYTPLISESKPLTSY